MAMDLLFNIWAKHDNPRKGSRCIVVGFRFSILSWPMCGHVLMFNVYTECLKKNGILWKNGHTFLQTHPKCEIGGCFGKFRIFATLWALRFSKLKEKCLRK